MKKWKEEYRHFIEMEAELEGRYYTAKEKKKLKETFKSKWKEIENDRVLNEDQEKLINRAAKLYKKSGMCAAVKKVADNILKSSDPWLNYRFASAVEGADIRAHGQVVINSRDPECNFLFAREFKNFADVKAHGQVVIDSKNPWWNFLFAWQIKEADINAHKQIVLNSKDSNCISQFETFVKSDSQTTLQDEKNILKEDVKEKEQTQKIFKNTTKTKNLQK